MIEVQKFISEINEIENINLQKKVRSFEKKLCNCFKNYNDNVGFEDFKMSDLDYVILYTVWKSLNIKDSLEAYLIIMYAYYKLEDFHFPLKKFCFKNVYEIIEKTEIIKIINIFI